MNTAVKRKPIEQMTPEEFMSAMADPLWRLNSLYWIKTKTESDDDDDEGLVVRFRPNRYQRRLLRNLHTRNIILKARQLGFTTLIQILFLDYALFTPNVRCGVIAHTDDAALKVFKKIKFAYDRLPDALKAVMPLVTCNAHEMELANGSVLTVGTSMRSDTIHYLHISEFGKICAQFPLRAEEVITGTIPAVPTNGVIFIESTSEGRDGAFFKMSQRAEALMHAGKSLTPKEYKFHFFPWHEAAEYQIDPTDVAMSPKDHEYFDGIEGKIGKTISAAQRAWWISTRDNDFAGEDEKMWQEYPSTPEEAFQQSTEGCYYTKQLAIARKQGRILPSIPVMPGSPCDTFWDIGNSDGTAIWVRQRIGMENRWIRFYEAWGESYSHAVAWLQSLGLIWGKMYLPHDADHVRQGQRINKSPKQMLEELMPGITFEIVERIPDVNWGIQQTRDVFPTYYFDEEHCKEGLAHIQAYKKTWNKTLACWGSEPSKAEGHSEAADAIRQHAQAHAAGILNVSGSTARRRRGNWRTA